MTVALGVLARNSQIIAADTQMSTDAEKLGQGKMFRQDRDADLD